MAENDDLLPEFLAEAADIIEKIHGDLEKLPGAQDRSELITAIFRNVHTLKGSSSMFNFSRTKSIAHELETNLGKFKESPQTLNDPEIQYIRDEVQKIDELLKAKDQLDLVPGTLNSPGEPSADTRADNKELLPAASKTPQATVNATEEYIRVTVNRVNETMNIVSEVFLIRNQMVYLVDRFKSGNLDQRDFFQTWDMLDGALRRGVGELERSTMSMRMMSVQGLFNRMARSVQSYSAKTNKKILFQTVGENTELDKKILDVLGEPLIHLIRNAMDHGIESPSDRIRSNKPEIGTIILSATISGNEAVVEVKDDGKGIDAKKILASAQKKGLDVSHVTDDQSAIELIFLPGFSTAETVSEVSGRGVGMDAVKTSVTSLSGKVTIHTEVGKGSTFSIRLPVSMSLAPVVLIDIKGLKYAVPTSDILETKQVPFSWVKRNSGFDYVNFRDKYVKCIDLRSIMDAEEKSHEENMRSCSIVFFRTSNETCAARVSSFERNTEIVVKPLSGLSPNIPWVYGVAVLPTGEAIFVLSLAKILEEFEVTNAA